MKNKILLKVLVIIYLLTFSINNIAFASTKNTNESYKVYCYSDPNLYIRYDNKLQSNYKYYYYDETNTQRLAYCLELGVPGAETFPNDHFVYLEDAIKDEKVLSILSYGYPYNSLENIGVENESKAIYATQFALWTYLSNLDINKITPTNDSNINVVNAIKYIYNNGINNSFTENNIDITYEYNAKIDNIDSSYYSVLYNINKSGIVNNLELLDFDDPNLLLTDENNNLIKKDDINNLSKFKVMIKRDKVSNNYLKQFLVKAASIKQDVALYGKSVTSGMQNMAIMLPEVKENTIFLNFNVEVLDEILKVYKIDSKTKQPLAGAVFGVYLDGNLLKTYTTDTEGKIYINITKDLNILEKKNIEIKEIEAPYGYEIYKSSKNILVGDGIEKEVLFEDEKIYGSIKIIKKSLDYNSYLDKEANTPLENVEFEIYNEKMELIQKLTTNKDGICKIENLPYGKYYIKEIKTNEYYILDDKIYEISITKNKEEKTIELKNKSMEKEVPLNIVELPKAGY